MKLLQNIKKEERKKKGTDLYCVVTLISLGAIFLLHQIIFANLRPEKFEENFKETQIKFPIKNNYQKAPKNLTLKIFLM